MAREHKTITADVRRRSQTWDRLKFIVLILFLLAICLIMYYL